MKSIKSACIHESTAQSFSSINIQKQLCNILKLLTYNKLNSNFTFTCFNFCNTAILHPDTYSSSVSVVLAFSNSARAHAPSSPASLTPRLRLGEKRARNHCGVGLRMHGPLASLLVLANPSTNLLIRMLKIFLNRNIKK